MLAAISAARIEQQQIVASLERSVRCRQALTRRSALQERRRASANNNHHNGGQLSPARAGPGAPVQAGSGRSLCAPTCRRRRHERGKTSPTSPTSPASPASPAPHKSSRVKSSLVAATATFGGGTKERLAAPQQALIGRGPACLSPCPSCLPRAGCWPDDPADDKLRLVPLARVTCSRALHGHGRQMIAGAWPPSVEKMMLCVL